MRQAEDGIRDDGVGREGRRVLVRSAIVEGKGSLRLASGWKDLGQGASVPVV